MTSDEVGLRTVRALPDSEPVEFSRWTKAVRASWITDEIVKETEEG